MKIKLIVITLLLFTSTIYANQEECDLEGFEKISNTLDKSKLESVTTLSDEFKKRSEHVSEACKESLFVSFRTFYYKSRRAFQEAGDIWNVLSSAGEDAANKKISVVGWKLRMSEGDFYIGEDSSWLFLNFQDFLPNTWKVYFSQRKIEIEEGFSEDAGLLISWEKLRSRIIFWEDFLKTNKNFPLSEEISYRIKLYLRTYLTGMDNSRIYDYDDRNKLREEVKVSYENFINENKNSQYHELINEYYLILKKNNFYTSKENWEFLRTKKINSMLGIQPPTY
ncbi:MAG: hypothetical protein OEY19_10035 [Gammaproteobacteria bacterium]|nr:hypothetical protein [Gammaproteobacteria bacterium]